MRTTVSSVVRALFSEVNPYAFAVAVPRYVPLWNMSAVVGELPVAPSTVTRAVDRVAQGLKLPSKVRGSAFHAHPVPGYGGSDLTAPMTCWDSRLTPHVVGGAA